MVTRRDFLGGILAGPVAALLIRGQSSPLGVSAEEKKPDLPELRWDDIGQYLCQTTGLPIEMYFPIGPNLSALRRDWFPPIDLGQTNDNNLSPERFVPYWEPPWEKSGGTKGLAQCVAVWNEHCAAKIRWHPWDRTVTPGVIAHILEQFIPMLIEEENHQVPIGQLWVNPEQLLYLPPGCQVAIRGTHPGIGLVE